MKTMIVVTHLLGSGHLSRAVTLAKGLRARGQEVVILSGGIPVPHLDVDGLEVVQLPPVRSDGVDFTALLDETGARVTPDLMARRRQMILDCFAQAAPDVLVTELFPFGRRMLREEFLPVLQAARDAGALVAASVRDILNPPSKPAKAAWADEMLARYYDAVLVHADPQIVHLSESWPVTPALIPRRRYTGFVAPPPASTHPLDAGRGEVLVSAGGGPVGGPIFAAARAAARQDPDRIWRLLVGGQDAAARINALAAGAPGNLIVEPARRDYRQMMREAAASVSMCGYNTALDLLQSGVPAVVIPFDTGGEREQALRAGAIARYDGIERLTVDTLTAAALRRAVDQAVAAPRRQPREQGMDGATRSADILTELLREKR